MLGGTRRDVRSGVRNAGYARHEEMLGMTITRLVPMSPIKIDARSLSEPDRGWESRLDELIPDSSRNASNIIIQAQAQGLPAQQGK